jgi:hypothetical protein
MQMTSVVTFRPVPKPSGSKRAMDRGKAEAAAAQVLGYIAEDGDTLAAFIHATGFDPKGLRKMRQRDLMVGVADFLMGSDDLIREYAERMELEPEALAAAARLLSPPH